MKKKMMILAATACVMALPLTKVNAANTPTPAESDVKVTYDFSNTINPTNPNYQISIPAGVVFSSTNPGQYVEMDVKMSPAQNATDIANGASAQISIKSANSYVVKLETTDPSAFADPVNYTVNYEGATITKDDQTSLIGTLEKGTTELIKGTAALNGVATKTGAHIDTLTYIVEDKSNITTN